jgi:hypothetical protein
MAVKVALHDAELPRAVTGRAATLIAWLAEHERAINRISGGSLRFDWGTSDTFTPQLTEHFPRVRAE